ncbi:MAG TPA: hypothetical protein VGQ37_05015 [Vicinamibacterales bacterium]|jgi:hypothetical protein|nr:hypothetical protein [Vicinamibacterales bacterium]
MFRRSSLVAIGLLALCGCKASYATVPSQADVVARVVLLYRFPTASIAVGSSASFDAMTVSPDGVYQSVTAQSQYFSSDLTVARPTGGAGVQAVGPGAAEVVVSYLGFTASLPVRVRPQTRTYPYIELSGSGTVAGYNATIRAILWSAPSQSRLITSEATWSSSDPSIATVTGGSVTTFRVGMTAITATFGGVSETLYYPVTTRG